MALKIKPLEEPDSHHLRAAQGWIGLGNHAEADKELDEIKPQLRTHPDVLEARWLICAHAKKWDACVDLAAAIVKLAPKRSFGWIHRSYALHGLKRTQEAFDNLLPVANAFPKVWMIPYNLACYCAQLGRIEESKDWFKKAMTIDEDTVKREGIDDPDLKPLWDSMSNTFWKRIE
jgi:tetratricopeptide (TPR) repeat protein